MYNIFIMMLSDTIRLDSPEKYKPPQFTISGWLRWGVEGILNSIKAPWPDEGWKADEAAWRQYSEAWDRDEALWLKNGRSKDKAHPSNRAPSTSWDSEW